MPRRIDRERPRVRLPTGVTARDGFCRSFVRICCPRARTRRRRRRRRRRRHGGGAGRVLRADRGQTGTGRADTGLQADRAQRVRGHRGGRAVRPGPAAGARRRRDRRGGPSRPRGPRQRVRVPAGQTPRHAVRDGPVRRARGRRPRTRGRPDDRHLHVMHRARPTPLLLLLLLLLSGAFDSGGSIFIDRSALRFARRFTSISYQICRV